MQNSGDNIMKRISFLLKVRESKIYEYKRQHASVWPEMLDALRRAGWKNYSLFMRPDGLLFGYFETTSSLADAVEAMSIEEVNSRWQSFMAPFFEEMGESHPNNQLFTLEEVFHLD